MKYIFSSIAGVFIGASILLGFGVYLVTQQEEESVGAPSANLFREISPVSDNQWDVGTSTARWRRVFAQYASSTAGSFFNQLDIGNTSTTTIKGDGATSTFNGGVFANAFRSNLLSCTEALETDSTGAIICGSDATGAGGWTDDGTVVRLTTATDLVGVGTTTPGATFALNGPAFFDSKLIRFGSSTAPQLTLAYQGAATNTVTQLVNAWNISTSTAVGQNPIFSVNGLNGRVGIGTSNPNDLLHILGTSDPTLVIENANINNTNSGKISFREGGDNQEMINLRYDGSANNFIIDTLSVTNAFAISRATGNVGIGTTSPAQLLSVAGDSYLTGGLGIGKCV